MAYIHLKPYESQKIIDGEQTAIILPIGSKYPYLEPLWVLEPFGFVSHDDSGSIENVLPIVEGEGTVVYYSDDKDGSVDWHSSLRMPKWASRLEVTLRDSKTRRIVSLTVKDLNDLGCKSEDGYSAKRMAMDHVKDKVGSVNAWTKFKVVSLK